MITETNSTIDRICEEKEIGRHTFYAASGAVCGMRTTRPLVRGSDLTNLHERDGYGAHIAATGRRTPYAASNLIRTQSAMPFKTVVRLPYHDIHTPSCLFHPID